MYFSITIAEFKSLLLFLFSFVYSFVLADINRYRSLFYKRFGVQVAISFEQLFP